MNERSKVYQIPLWGLIIVPKVVYSQSGTLIKVCYELARWIIKKY